jgi:DNA invertase Pin-like site-specific DNA recombinase
MAGNTMAALLAVFAEFEREVLRERVCAGLAHARQNGKRLGRPVTAAIEADQVRKLRCAGISKSEIARRLRAVFQVRMWHFRRCAVWPFLEEKAT